MRGLASGAVLARDRMPPKMGIVAGMSLDDPARPVSEDDRRNAVSQLRRAAEDGRLTPQELDRRLAQVHQARLVGELGAALDGLGSPQPLQDSGGDPGGGPIWPTVPPPGEPTVPSPQVPAAQSPPGYRPDDRLNLTAGFSSEKRTGHWVIPPFLRVQAGFADVKLDCRHAQAASSVIDLEIGMGASTFKLILPPGWAVNADRLNKGLGTIKVKVPSTADAGCPTIVVHGQMGVGTFVARQENWVERRFS